MGPEARVAVCETAAEMAAGDPGWERLAAETRRVAPDVLLLNEMPFGRWIAADPTPDPEALRATLRAHEEGIARLAELGAPAVLGTRPAEIGAGVPDDDAVRNGDGRAVNEAFTWTRERGLAGVHTKQAFPEEKGYWEARWFRAGAPGFRATPLALPGGGLRVGFLICTEVWFGELARRLGREGADLIVVPRATPPESTDRWRTAVRMAALVSGCYAASSNRAGADSRGERFGGHGWVFGPDGELLAETSPDRPVAAAEIAVATAERAKREYPCYVDPAGGVLPGLLAVRRSPDT